MVQFTGGEAGTSVGNCSFATAAAGTSACKCSCLCYERYTAISFTTFYDLLPYVTLTVVLLHPAMTSLIHMNALRLQVLFRIGYVLRKQQA